MVSAPDPLARRAETAIADWAIPNWRSNTVFGAKVIAHRARRRIANLLSGPQRWGKSLGGGGFPTILGESRTPLWSDARPEERQYQLGKVQNLRRAAAALDGVVVPADGVFSFWKQIGRASRRRGFVTGRMLQQGCLVPAAGGGLCQLSNAIYEAALQSGCEIVERHAHSRIVTGSAAAAGRDATVAWNYVDLRFRARSVLKIEAQLTRDELVIRLVGRSGARPLPSQPRTRPAYPHIVARSCSTCGETACSRHEHHEMHDVEPGRTAFLVDENWPEFQDYVGRTHRVEDILGLPLDGSKWHLSRYRLGGRWLHPEGRCAAGQALTRAIAIRRAPVQGAARRNAELNGTGTDRRAPGAAADPRRYPGLCGTDRCCRPLWREGASSAAARIEVLMTRLPMAELQARLDRAFTAHPERTSLGDFRAPPAVVSAESAALAYASRIVTPHREVGRLFPDKTVILDWHLPPIRPIAPAGRPRRAYCLSRPDDRAQGRSARCATRRDRLGWEVVTLGSELEGPSFLEWRSRCGEAGAGVRLAQPGGRRGSAGDRRGQAPQFAGSARRRGSDHCQPSLRAWRLRRGNARATRRRRRAHYRAKNNIWLESPKSAAVMPPLLPLRAFGQQDRNPGPWRRDRGLSTSSITAIAALSP